MGTKILHTFNLKKMTNMLSATANPRQSPMMSSNFKDCDFNDNRQPKIEMGTQNRKYLYLRKYDNCRNSKFQMQICGLRPQRDRRALHQPPTTGNDKISDKVAIYFHFRLSIVIAVAWTHFFELAMVKVETIIDLPLEFLSYLS